MPGPSSRTRRRVPAVGGGLGLRPDVAASAQRLGRVGQQVDEDLPNLVRVDVGGQSSGEIASSRVSAAGSKAASAALSISARKPVAVPARRTIAGEV